MKNKGFGIIILLIFIIVIVTLTSIYISNKFNLDKKEVKETFQKDITRYYEELNMYIKRETNKNNTFDISSFNASAKTLKNIFFNFSEKYLDKIEIVAGKLVYIGEVVEEKEWFQELFQNN